MQLSDQALSILAFAAYHQLESGDVVSEVVVDDGQGHKASAKGVEELQQAGLLTVDGSRGTFTEQGASRLQSVVQAIRS
jgi:hypothetical protein